MILVIRDLFPGAWIPEIHESRLHDSCLLQIGNFKDAIGSHEVVDMLQDFKIPT